MKFGSWTYDAKQVKLCAQISIFAKIFALRHISDIASPLTEQHLSRFVGRGIAPKKLPGNMKPLSLFSKEKKMMEQTLRSFVLLLAPSQEHMFERKLIKHRGSDKVSFHNHILLNFCK